MAKTLFAGRRLNVYFGKTARGDNGDGGWRGHYWGSDFPKARMQRGSCCNVIDLSWLCYFVSIYWHKRRPAPQEGE